MKLQHNRLALAVVALFFVAGLFRLNDLSLYTDSTRYLIWGHSLSQLRGFLDDTQVIPSRFVMNAPLYPILLAPVQWAFPLSLTAAKAWTLLWGSFALLLFFLWLRRHFDQVTSILLTLAFAVNPLFLTVSTEVLSEAPFLVVLGLLLISAERHFLNPDDKAARVMFMLCIAGITMLREVGAAFVFAGLIVLFRQKRGRDLLLAFLFSAGLFLLWTVRNSLMVGGSEEGQSANLQYMFRHFVTSQQASIIAEFGTRAWLNFQGYAVNLGGRIMFPFPDSLIGSSSSLYVILRAAIDSGRLVLLIVFSLAIMIGLYRDLRSGPGGLFRILSIAGYLVIILVYPVHDIRFLLPLTPLFLFYLAKAWHLVEPYLRSRRGKNITAALLLVLLITPNAVASLEILRTNMAYRADPLNYSHTLDSNTNTARHFSQPWSLVGSWVASKLPSNAVFASPAKEIAPFVYPRPVLETSRVLPAPVFERFLRDYNARFLVTVNAWDSVETFLLQMTESRRLWFELLSETAGIRVYAIHSSILEKAPQRRTIASDTVSARGLLLLGRQAMLRSDFAASLGFFAKALHLEPTQPELAFQIMSSLSFLGDSSGATNMVQQLLTLPRSTAYTQSIQGILSIMEQTLKARRMKTPSQQSFALFETALGYWGLGYRETALSVIRKVVSLDSTNFVGALWGTYFAKELGDTVESNRFLRRLMSIDRNAQIARDWESVRQLENRLRKAMPANEAARLHIEIAQVYAKIELYDEALDATLRALRLEPENVDLWLYMGEVMERKKARPGAVWAYREVLEREPHNSFAQARIDSLSF